MANPMVAPLFLYMERTESVWRRTECGVYGVPLAVGDEINSRFDNISLTIRRLRRQGVGTLVITNKRFVFMLPEVFEAWTCKLSSFETMEVLPIESCPGYCCLYIRRPDEYFTFQGRAEQIAAIQAQLATCDITVSVMARPTKAIKAPTRAPKVIAPRPTPGMAGAAIQVEKKIERNRETVRSVKCLNDLKARAETLKRFAADLQRTVSSSKEAAAAKDTLNRVCLAVGIESPVDAKAGTKEIALEFGQTMTKIFKHDKSISVLTKAEAYVHYIRARKSELLSPKDVDKAIELIRQSKLKGVAIKIENIGGVTVIMPGDKAYVSGVQKAFRKMKRHAFYTSLSLAKEFSLPTSIATMFLERSVENGDLVVDESMAGRRYYRNRFHKFDLMPIT